MATIREIYKYIDEIAPFETQLGFDNAGFLIGDGDKEISRAYICLDATVYELKQAKEFGCPLVITHHPIIWEPRRELHPDDAAYVAVRNDIAVISAHTNLDLARGGVNDCLAQTLGLKETELISETGLGVIGTLPQEFSSREFAKLVRDKLHCGAVSYTEGRRIKNVAVIGGAAGEDVLQQLRGSVDAAVTGEAKHHILLEAQTLNKTLVVAGHYETENIVIEPLREKLAQRFADIEFISAKERPPVKYI